MKKALLLLIANFAFADNKINFSENETILLFIILGSLILILLIYIAILKSKLKSKKVKMFSGEENIDSDTNIFEKSAFYFDMQEVFLYFFKTLNYEASVRNNVFLVRQDMFKYDDNKNKTQIARYFYGDYTNIINTIWSAADLINQNVENETIILDFKIIDIIQERVMFSVDIGLCGAALDSKSFELVQEFVNPKKLSIIEQIHKLKTYINKIDSAKYVFTDSAQKSNHIINIKFPLVTSNFISELEETVAKDKTNALIIHQNTDISKTIASNLESFGVNCIQNQSPIGLLERLEDAANCNFRIVLLDVNMIASLNEFELLRLVKDQDIYKFKLIIILNNHKISPLLEKIIQDVDFLPLPYTVDNIRAVVNTLNAEQERYLN